MKFAFTKNNFLEYHDESYSPHAIVHGMLGCDMYEMSNAAYDTVFWLHHAFVDKLWAYWQELQQLRSLEEHYIHEFDLPFPPFKKIGREVVDYRSNLCYDYDHLIFDDKTPGEYKRDEEDKASKATNNKNINRFGSFFRTGKLPGKCGDVCTEIKGRKDCEAVCEGDGLGKYFRKIYVGVVMPEVGPTGTNEFNLCQGNKCVKGGRVGSFGGTKEDTEIQSNEVVDDKKFKIVEVDVTEVMETEEWSFKKPLEAKMTSTVESNLPAPVVIIKKLDKDGKVISNDVEFSPNEKRKRYGNLLNKYSNNDGKKNSQSNVFE